jgi:hypothetical protein
VNFFEEVELRLKQLLGTTDDKDVAKMLGMSPRAWAGRKKRNSFPEKELWVLVAQRPDLELDIGYVLNGIRKSEAALTKSLIEIIDRYLTVYKLNPEQADEKLSLPPGTIAKALSFQLQAEPAWGKHAEKVVNQHNIDKYRGANIGGITEGDFTGSLTIQQIGGKEK